MSVITSEIINTPIGQMIASADDKYLYELKFTDKLKSSNYINISNKKNNNIIIKNLKLELKDYFNGYLKIFKTPINISNIIYKSTDFQKTVWRALLDIPYGKTISYLQESKNINKPKAFRAVANANGKNPISIIIPCHRVINNNGELGGYSSGIEKKQWLLKHEKNNI